MYGRSDEGTENEDGEEGGEISGGGKRVEIAWHKGENFFFHIF